MPPGSARPSSRAAMLTPRDERLALLLYPTDTFQDMFVAAGIPIGVPLAAARRHAAQR
jgi:hypothetical protein